MEGLRHLARRTFETQEFLETNQEGFSCVSIQPSASHGNALNFETLTVREHELVGFIGSELEHTSTGVVVPTLRLVRIPIHMHTNETCSRFEISRSAFLALVNAMRLDPCVLHLIAHECHGFHHSTSDDGIFTGFLETLPFIVAWTFDPKQVLTRVLMLVRWDTPFLDLGTSLQTYKEHIYTPAYLVFVMVIHGMWMWKIHTSVVKKKMYEIESETGYGTGTRSRMRTKLDIDAISSWLEDLGKVQRGLSAILIDLREASKMIYFVSDMKAEALQLDAGRDVSLLRQQQTSLETLRKSLPMILGMVDSHLALLSHFQDRANNMRSVLFALLTHEDALANINLADASRALAEAAQRDNSSMKTIAIMTMAFLPATFYAALFGLPLFQWGQENVVQPGFWVYCVFTGVSTGLVFLAWFAITHRHEVRGWYKKLKRLVRLRKGEFGGKLRR